MRLIVGLGNPGRRYRGTRHNIGHDALEIVARTHHVSISTDDGWAETGRGTIGGRRVILARPETYVNVSGAAVADLRRRYRVAPADLLVIYDDLDLPVGTVRLRPHGSHGGHNGMRSIIEALGNNDFPRMRIGIGRPPDGVDPADYVLERPSPAERTLLDEAIRRAADGVTLWMAEGIDAAMRHCNPKQSTPRATDTTAGTV
jgi:PTH1 family peptidyl-tRNA hydrolase